MILIFLILIFFGRYSKQRVVNFSVPPLSILILLLLLLLLLLQSQVMDECYFSSNRYQRSSSCSQCLAVEMRDSCIWCRTDECCVDPSGVLSGAMPVRWSWHVSVRLPCGESKVYKIRRRVGCLACLFPLAEMMERSEDLLRCLQKIGETWHTPVRGKESDNIGEDKGEGKE